MNKETKINLSVGCTEYLVKEVESLRRQNEILDGKMSVVNNFFGMINRIGDKPSQGYGEDLLWQAKKEIEEAKRMAQSSPEST